MNADKLINEYLADRVNTISNKPEDWQSYTDPFTERTVWYDQEAL